MNGHSAAAAVTVAALALITLAGPANGQSTVSNEVEWPAAPAGPAVFAATLAESQAGSPTPLPVPAVSEDVWFATSVLLTSITSIGGLYGGAWLGYTSTDEYGGGWAEEIVAAYIGAGVGSNVAAITTGGLLNGNWGWTVLGSLAGSVAGTLVGAAIGEGGGTNASAIAMYGLTHGLITTLAGRR